MPDLSTLALMVLLAACFTLAAIAFVLWRSRDSGEPHAALIAELARVQTDNAARLEALMGHFTNTHSQLQRSVNERLDSVTHRLGESLAHTTHKTAESLQKLNERLAVFDSAQQNITQLATSLQSILANKQSRGAFGQGRMEIIIRDGLPKGCYAFEYTLPNKTRPDCVIFPPDNRPLVIDAKFPLEASTAYRDARSEDERKLAAARLRQDVTKHINDVAKYLVPGETQELAFMFVPSESIYAELHEDFDDLVQKAFRARVMIVSPTLLMLAIQLVRQNQRDFRMREAADQIRDEVGRLVNDVGLLGDRIRKLQAHFNQSSEDIRQSIISIEKIESRGERIVHVEFDGAAADDAPALSAPVRKLQAGE